MDELGPMFGIYSSGPSLPWLWIIEYVSSFPEIDTSIIRGLIEAAPVLPDDLGKNASERVALRCLEELFGPKNGLENVAPPDSGVTFDLSSSCVDVLEHIVQEVSLSNLKKAGPELLRWDVQPFIMHKRASLAKCALEQLKGSNLEKIPVLDGDENCNQKGNLIPQITENDNEVLQDGLLERNLSDLVDGNLVGLVSVNQDSMHNDYHLNAGEGDQDLHVASRTLEQINVVGDVELKDNQMENVQNVDADVRVEQKYGDRPCQDVVMDELNYVENGALQKGPSGYAGGNIDQGFPLSSPNSTSADGLQQNIDPGEAKADMEHPCADQICENEDERFDIALKKSLFLSSQCRPSQDPAGKAVWTEQNLCVKCNRNGQVLLCSSSGCPLVVHESCLLSAARFDDKGNFYCPFCAYSLYISKYLEAKEKSSLARKELPAFLEICSKKHTEEQRKLQSHSRLNGDEELVGIQESGHLAEKEHDFISQNREVNHGPASCLNGNKLCVEEETSMSGAVDVQGENNEGEEQVVLGDRSMREHEEEVLQAKLKSNDDNPTSENIETVTANQVEVEGDIVKEAVEPQITDQPQKPACSLNRAGEESSANENDKLIISSYSQRSRKRETNSVPPAPNLRRKVPWTKDEEEMLRKGVEKFVNHGKNVPWKKILDFGTKVFLRDRTAADLKDKWKNMHGVRWRCN